MSELLKAHENWDSPPVCFLQGDELIEEEDHYEDEITEGLLEEESIAVDPKEVASGIVKLSNMEIIDSDTADHLNAIHSTSLKTVDYQCTSYRLIHLTNRQQK